MAGTSTADVPALTVPTRSIRMRQAGVAGGLPQPVDRLEHLDHGRQQLLPLPADPRAGPAAVEQGDAQLALQLAQRLAQRRLGEVQPLARPAQRPVPGDGREVLQLLDPHAAPRSLDGVSAR